MRLRNSRAGFTLIETAVALVIALGVIGALGLLGEHLTRQRADNEGNATATALATRKMEELLAVQNPTADARLNPPGTYSQTVDETGSPSVGGPYAITWTVADNVPIAGSKRIQVVATIMGKANVQSQLVTYLRL